MCDANRQFVWMNCRFGGNTNDIKASATLNNALNSTLLSGFWVAGDAAYYDSNIGGRIVTPYIGKLSKKESNFNFYLSQLRINIECAFALLKGRWGVLWRPLRFSMGNNVKIIEALFCLHNLANDKAGRVDEVAEVAIGRASDEAAATLRGIISGIRQSRDRNSKIQEAKHAFEDGEKYIDEVENSIRHTNEDTEDMNEDAKNTNEDNENVVGVVVGVEDGFPTSSQGDTNFDTRGFLSERVKLKKLVRPRHQNSRTRSKTDRKIRAVKRRCLTKRPRVLACVR